MKICLAQTLSFKGAIDKNIQNHLRLINSAIKLKVDLIVFPELSITSYKPTLANELATISEDPIFHPFQKIADKNSVAICVGMPLKALDGINISMLVFRSNQKPLIYSKQILHADELPFFVCGNEQVFLDLKGHKIALGICYETLQRQHFLNTHNHGADVYIASVAKPTRGIEKANTHFSKIAKEFKKPILMANSVGNCDNFLSVGQSAVWDKNGISIHKLDDKRQGLLVYDTDLESAEIIYQTV
jgi:predicted amidohydrolase